MESWRNNESSEAFPSLHTTLSDDTERMSMGARPQVSEPILPQAQLGPLTLTSSRPQNAERAISTPILPTNLDTNNNSDLHDAARITDWPRVLTLSQTSPHLANYRCPDGMTPLHHVCTRRCNSPQVVSALVHAYPPALVVCDERGWTPLHHACRFKAPTEAVRILLHDYVEKGRWSARQRCNHGRTPLYYAIRYDAPSGVMELLLEFMRTEDVLGMDTDGRSVLALVWDEWARVHEGKKSLKFLTKYVDGPDGSGNVNASLQWEQRLHNAERLRNSMRGKVKEKWELANLLLRGAYGFPLQDEEEQEQLRSSTNNFDVTDTTSIAMDEDVHTNTITNNRRFRVLHATAAAKCHPTLFMMACVLHPEQAREIDENELLNAEGGDANRRTALHFAAMKASMNSRDARYTLQTLLEFNPDAVSLPNPADGSLPLHYLCQNEHRMHWVHDGVEDIYNAYTEAARLRDNMGRLPLHHATSVLASRQYPLHTGEGQPGITISIVQELVRLHRNTASISDNDGKLPMHIIAEEAETWDDNVESLYEAYPQALRDRTSRQTKSRLPIHLVAMNPDAQLDLVEAIVNKNKMGASTTDGQGKLPFHYMCEVGKAWEGGLNVMYDVYRKAIQTKEDNERKWLPLHSILMCPSAPLNLIEKILSLYPEAISVVDGHGKTPLHLAVEGGKDWECCDLLFKANPDAIYAEDARGCIPFVLGALTFCDRRGRSSSNSSVSEGSDLDGEAVPLPQPTNVSRGLTRHGSGALREKSTAQITLLYSILRTAPHVLDSYNR